LPDLKTEFGIEFSRIFENAGFCFANEMWLVGSGRDTTLPGVGGDKVLQFEADYFVLGRYPGFRAAL